MKKNMGGVDKLIRLILAGIFIVLYFSGVIQGTLGIVLLVLASIFVLTSSISSCPLYLPFGINTIAKEKK
ncbi:YgaP family membrane protein [Flavobacterium sp.]|uniref:YgaP family membrane protein n=1 Tax=Flavobacterium sp. TaxID=239 RepID=UPI003BB9C6BC